MTSPSVTELLERWRDGDSSAHDDLLPLLYRELHSMAHRRMARERVGHTLQTTALIHEAFVRLVDHPTRPIESRQAFFRIAASCMRRILVEHARARASLKAGGDRRRTLLDDAVLAVEDRGIDLLEVGAATERLAQVDRELSEVVEMRFFGGLEFGAIATTLGVTERTVYRRWALARAWLKREIDA